MFFSFEGKNPSEKRRPDVGLWVQDARKTGVCAALLPLVVKKTCLCRTCFKKTGAYRGNTVAQKLGGGFCEILLLDFINGF
jgi:hypothetical protein